MQRASSAKGEYGRSRHCWIALVGEMLHYPMPVVTVGIAMVTAGSAVVIAIVTSGHSVGWAVALIALLVPAFVGAGVYLENRHLQLREAPGSKKEQEFPVRGEAFSAEAYYRLAELVRRFDPDTYEHSARLAEIGVELGLELGFGPTQVESLRWAATLHDIGKIAVSQVTLNKIGRLTTQELAEIRRHPSIGAALIEAVVPFEKCLIDAVRHHHERWDGGGYPSAMRGQQIPIEARVLAVVDVFEALTSNRPYRAALSPEQAAIYIRQSAGTHFDPHIVDVFLGLLARGRIRPRATLNSR